MFRVFNIFCPTPVRSAVTSSVQFDEDIGSLTTAQSTSPARPKIGRATGLIVTEELDVAIERCRNKVNKLASECRAKNRRYRDIEFDLLEDRDVSLHAVDTKSNYTPADARRVTQIFNNPRFFVDGIPTCDVAPGGVWRGSWFSSAMGLVATAGLIERVCVARDEEIGIYGFIFWRDGGWTDVIIDDLLFSKIPRWEELTEKEQYLYQKDAEAYNRTARKGNKSLYFSRSTTENETWVSLLEKAYAKLGGDYASLEKRWTSEVVEDLTGALASYISIQDILDTDQFWEEELSHANEDRLFSVMILPTTTSEAYRSTSHLSANQFYYVTRALTVNGKRFLLMRNPWGCRCHEWTGRWGDGSKEWTREWLERLGNGEFGGYTFGKEGHFMMEYSDFLETWNSLDKYRLFDSSWALTQLWLNVDVGPHPRAWDYGDVSFTVHIPKPTRGIIALLLQASSEEDSSFTAPYIYSLDFVIYKSGETEPYASSTHTCLWHRNVNVEIDMMEEGDYVVHVRFDRSRKFSSGLSSIPPPPPSPPHFSTSLPASTSIDTKSRKFAHTRMNYLFSSSVAQNFRAVNHATDLPLPPGTFVGKDLTEMEIEIHSKIVAHKATVKDIFQPPLPPKPSTTPKPSQRLSAQSKVEVSSADTTVVDRPPTPNECEVQQAPKQEDTATASVVEEVPPPKDDTSKDSSADFIEIELGVSNEASNFPSMDSPSDIEKPVLSSDETNDDLKKAANMEAPVVNSSPSLVHEPDTKSEAQPDTDESNPQPSSLSISELKKDGEALEEKLEVSRPKTPSSANVKPSNPPSPSPAPFAFRSPVRSPSPPLKWPTLHTGFVCHGCDLVISGSRFKCLNFTCFAYNLCSKCMAIGAHTHDHKFLEIPTPQDADFLWDTTDGDEDNQIIVGLRVYTDKESKAIVRGQLRHGSLIRKGLTTRRII